MARQEILALSARERDPVPTSRKISISGPKLKIHQMAPGLFRTTQWVRTGSETGMNVNSSHLLGCIRRRPHGQPRGSPGGDPDTPLSAGGGGGCKYGPSSSGLSTPTRRPRVRSGLHDVLVSLRVRKNLSESPCRELPDAHATPECPWACQECCG